MLESQINQAVTSVRAGPREGVCLPDDAEKNIARGFVGGAPASLEQAVKLYRGRIARLGWRLLGWRGDVEDVVQDVFLAAWENRHKFRGGNGLWPWLMTITVNHCRSRRRRELLWIRWLWRADRSHASAMTTEARPERDETAERVRTAVGTLPTGDREVVVLHYLEQLSVREISAILNCSPGAVDVRLHRARKRLRKMLGDLDAC